ncbi:LacI family DNA-binding transcriptional regulator [Streptomyces sp. NPDC051776]|uniref:LacI family DNA-binding transcriptional regulator n=1 Tax=Streptomyces sp. NPDC051776 TaxID=3155414 RepID=UPI003423AB22
MRCSNSLETLRHQSPEVLQNYSGFLQKHRECAPGNHADFTGGPPWGAGKESCSIAYRNAAKFCHTHRMASRASKIAEFAGVSEATVSRVLNGKPGVAEATRESVLTALDVLGLERPTQLRKRANQLAGVVVPEMTNPVFPSLTAIIGSRLAQRGITPILFTGELSGIQEKDFVNMLLDHSVSGVVFVCCQHSVRGADHDHYTRLVERGMPVVGIQGVSSDLQMACVSSDDFLAADTAVRHLVSLGHRRLGLAVGDHHHIPAARKIAGFRTAVGEQIGEGEDAGRIVETAYSLQGGVTAAEELLEQGVTGIICGSDVIALGVIRGARRMKLRVPEDVSVIGYDDSLFMPSVDPPLTTVRQNLVELGLTAVSLLMRQMAGETVSLREMLFEPELVVRGSTAAAPKSVSV